jgi:hypothetical protein
MKLAKVEVMLPRPAERRIDDALIFDSRGLDVGTRQELLRLLPQLMHLSRANRAIYQKHGCRECPKPDPTVTIAARLRRGGMSWSEVYETVGVLAATRAERKKFEQAVRWKLAHLETPKRKHWPGYGAGGLCMNCYLRRRRELAKELGVHARTIGQRLEERDAAAETAALTQRHDLAQWLLGGEE